MVSIPDMKKMFKKVRTPDEKKRMVAFEKGVHVLPSGLQNENLDEVRKETFKFVEEVLNMKSVR